MLARSVAVRPLRRLLPYAALLSGVGQGLAPRPLDVRPVLEQLADVEAVLAAEHEQPSSGLLKRPSAHRPGVHQRLVVAAGVRRAVPGEVGAPKLPRREIVVGHAVGDDQVVLGAGEARRVDGGRVAAQVDVLVVMAVGRGLGWDVLVPEAL